MPAQDPQDRRDIARLAALTRWSREDPTRQARIAQAGLRERFAREVDEEAAEAGETLLPAERERRIECKRRAFYVDLARRSRIARRAKGLPAPARVPAALIGDGNDAA